MNINDFEKSIKSLDQLIPIHVESKQTIELKQGVWNGETISGSEYIPNDAPDSYKIYRRLYLSFMNRRAIFESLYYNAGGIDTQRYLDAVKEIETNLVALKKHYNYKSCSLLIVNKNDNPTIQNKLFNDYYLCEQYCKKVLGVTLKDIQSQQLPEHLKGTRVFDQEWYTSEEDLIRNYPTPSNTTAVSPKTNTVI